MGVDNLSEILTREVVNQFQKDGAVLLKGVFSMDWIERIRRGIERNLKDPSPYAQWLQESETGGIYFNDYCNWKKIPEFEKFVMFSPAGEIAATLTSSKELRFYHEHVLDKAPGTEKPTPWHQDQPYYPIDGNKVCSIWMPVDPVPLGSSLRLVKGSHKWGRWFRPRMFATCHDYNLFRNLDGRYESLSPEEINSKKHEILEWSVEPGDCVVFHMLTVHGAAGNTSLSTHRRVFATRWLGEDAHLVCRPWKVSPPQEAVFADKGEPSLQELPLVWRS